MRIANSLKMVLDAFHAALTRTIATVPRHCEDSELVEEDEAISALQQLQRGDCRALLRKARNDGLR